MKRDAADTAFSNFIRERDNFTCQRCRKVYSEGRRQGLHCSHIFSRRHQATRFHSKNAKALCFKCHQWFGSDVVESAKWVRDKFGSEAIDELERRKNQIVKRTKKEKKEIAAHWRSQLEYMRRCRTEGRQFEVMEWD